MSQKSGYLYDGMKLPFILLVTCFAAWGIAANMTDPLVKVFSKIFSMSTLQASFVQFAYYGAYFCLALPAAFINRRFSYKTGVLVGLGCAIVGAFLFYPAAQAMTFGFFLLALFTLAGGLSILETSANPFVIAMGPEHNATRRLNFAQAFNPVGTNIGVLLAASLILPRLNTATAEERAAMTPEGHEIHFGATLRRLLRNRHYRFGVIAQFFNVAAQTCVWTFTIQYVMEAIGGTEADAGWYLQASLIVFLISRFVMVWLMGFLRPAMLLLLMALGGTALCFFAMSSPNITGVWAVVMISACLSLMFPTIYGIALHGLGDDTKFGAAGLVMAILGGALLPLVHGAVMDAKGAAFSYIVPGLCFLVVAAYGLFDLRIGARRHAHNA